jgi:endonuclease/exonuclease/phosphatase family metal-dependent hydrolase
MQNASLRPGFSISAVSAFVILAACSHNASTSRDLSQSSKTFTVATYNIQGMSDDKGSDFPPDYSASQSNWISNKMYDVKAAHIAEALSLVGAPDIVALEEVKYIDKNASPMKTLMPHIEKLGYKYWAYGPQSPKHPKGYTASDTQAIISKFPILAVEGLSFVDTRFWGASRDPLAVTIDVFGSPLRIYAVHTKAKVSERTPEDAAIGDSVRKAMLQVVRNDITKQRAQNPNIDIIVMGDMNAGYHEESITQGLGVTGNEADMLAIGNDESRLYNLWHEMNPAERCTTTFMGARECIDHINISSSLYDNHGIQYIDNSFSVAGMKEWWKSPLVSATGTGQRWQTRVSDSVDATTGKSTRFTTHLGYGYSDHIPLVATFRAVGNTNNTSRMPLASAPSTYTMHSNLFFHIPYCTNAAGEFNRGETVFKLSSTTDLSSDGVLGKCFELENGSIPLQVVDRYDTRADYGFVFESSNPHLRAVSLNIQYDDQNVNGRKIDRKKLLQEFTNTVEPALAAGKKVYLKNVKGRLDVSFGKVMLFAEGPIEVRID